MKEEHRIKAAEMKRKAERLFTEHPEESGESFLQHLKFTTTMSGRIIGCGLLLLIHGFFPFLLKHAVSGRIDEIHRILMARVKVSPGGGSEPAGDV